MSNLKKLQIVVYKHELIRRFKHTNKESFYIFQSLDYISYPITVSRSSFLDCLLAYYKALKSFQRAKGENEIPLNNLEVVEEKIVNYNNLEKWQRKKNFR